MHESLCVCFSILEDGPPHYAVESPSNQVVVMVNSTSHNQIGKSRDSIDKKYKRRNDGIKA